MKTIRKHYYFSIILLASIFLFFGCEKEFQNDNLSVEAQIQHDFFKISDEKNSKVGATPIAKSRDKFLIAQFTNTLLEIERRKPFMNSFLNDFGNILWAHSLELNLDENGSKILLLPSSFKNGSELTGVWAFYTNGVQTKLDFRSRTQIIDTEKGNSKYSALFRNVLNEFENYLNKTDLNLEIESRGGGEEDCEGGSFWYMCLTFFYDEDSYNYHTEYWPDWIDPFHMMSFSQLPHPNDVLLDVGSLLTEDQYNDYVAYYDARSFSEDPNGTLVDSDDDTPGAPNYQSVNCYNVWVWCWQDPADFNIQSIGLGSGSGSGGSTNNSESFDQQIELLKSCIGYDLPYDVDPQNGGNSDGTHPNYEFCALWQSYMDNCLNDSPIGFYQEWAENLSNDPALFDQMINNQLGCLNNIQFDFLSDPESVEEECDDIIRGYVLDFESTYNMTLTDVELNSILISGGLCGNESRFENIAINSVVRIFLNENPFHKEKMDEFKSNHPHDLLAVALRKQHVMLLRADSNYKLFIESTAGWSGIMWTIAKEVIGDKVVDLIINLFPGFGQKDEVKNAIKAAKNGEILEFLYEAAIIVGENTPIGKYIKGLDAFKELSEFYKKVDRIWDKISGYAENVLEEMWDIVSKYPESIRINSELIGSISNAINRGLKTIDDVMVSIPGFSEMTELRLEHILHGDETGGLHHVSGLINNIDNNVSHYFPQDANGVYKIIFNGKSSTMFPDSMDEIEVATSIQYIFDNFPVDEIADGKPFIEGLYNNMEIRIDLFTDGTIKTAYPFYKP